MECSGKASGRRQEGGGPFKSRKGFGLHVRQARARPSNTTVRELLSNDKYTEAVLDFLRKTKVGMVKEGVICKQAAGQGIPIGLMPG